MSNFSCCQLNKGGCKSFPHNLRASTGSLTIALLKFIKQCFCAFWFQAIVTPLFSHQKKALFWMIEAENSNGLPPFWEEKASNYFNTIAVFTTKKRPDPIRGGTLLLQLNFLAECYVLLQFVLYHICYNLLKILKKLLLSHYGSYN